MQKMYNTERFGQNTLISSVKKLFEYLLDFYRSSEPLNKSWRDKDSDCIFVQGSGIVEGGWRQRKKEKEREVNDRIWLLILTLSFEVTSFFHHFFPIYS